MKVLQKFLIAASVLAFAGGCSVAEPDKSAEYYVAHPSEIQPKLAECAAKAGAKNCASAEDADRYVKHKAYVQSVNKSYDQAMQFFAPPHKK